MKRFALILAAAALIALSVVSSAQADFGFDDFDLRFTNADGSMATQAGSHPFAVTTELHLHSEMDPQYGVVPSEQIKDLRVQLPQGLVGEPTAVPRCSSSDFSKSGFAPDHTRFISGCPDDSAVGVISLKLHFRPFADETGAFTHAPVYNLNPPPGVVQRFGFYVLEFPVTIDFTINPDPPYNIIARASNIAQPTPFLGEKLTVWGNPASPLHDSERGNCVASNVPNNVDEEVTKTGGSCPTGVAPRSFVTLPRACDGPLTTGYEADSWLSPGAWTPLAFVSTHDDATPPNPEGLSGCGKLRFQPTIVARPTSKAAQSSTGLDFSLDVDDKGLTDPDGIANSDIKKAVVTLPAGMSVNPSVAGGLGVCSEADLARETLDSAPGAGCPGASKIGTVEVETPLLDESVDGSLYVAKQEDNPFHSLLALYMVIKNPNLGVIIKQAMKVVPDETSGQLTTTVEEIPQLPFSHFKLNFRAGGRSPLTSPSGCGSYNAEAVLTPWAGGAPVTTSSTFQVNTGAGGTPCPPGGVAPFKPAFEAGTLAPVAGAYSPFVLKVSREGGSAGIGSVDATLPAGLLGKLAGIGECSEAQIAAARSRVNPGDGAREQASPSCPLSAEVGVVNVGAGSGSPTYVQGRAYLAGPYKGAPLSLAIITPAVAGPFDLGSVVVRSALYVDPTTTQLHAVSDPIPTILHGIPLDVRSIAVNMNRPNFTLNPTSCEPTSVLGGATSTLGQIVALSSGFQVGGCRGLDFAPKLSLALIGPTHRSAHPKFKATLVARGGDANIGRAAVTLPKTELLENAHIGTICTRVQYVVHACPARSVYGYAKAWSPLLDEPLQGPVYLRANGGERELPDLVASLDGQIHVDLVGYIDSTHARIRNTFAATPDAPVSKFVLTMQGGKKGLLVNNTELCKTTPRATVKFTGQNGKAHDFNPVVKADCGKKGKSGK